MLGRLTRPEGVETETVVVVDGSTDGTLELLKSEFPQVHVVHGTGSWWYTRSMNEGFRYGLSLKPDFFLTLNDDIILPEDYLVRLVECYNEAGLRSIIGSVSYTHNTPHRITNPGVKNWNRLIDKSTLYYPFLKEVDPASLKGLHSTPVLPGRGMLIPRSIAEELDFFDEKFKQYHSDFDFTLRARIRGVNVFVCWDAKVFSFVEKTASGSSFLKSSFRTLLKSFRNPYGRSYIPDRSRYYWRHGIKLLWPVYMLKFFILTFKNHFFKTKLA